MALFNDLYLTVLAAFDRDEEGQGLAEYALILTLIAIVAVIAVIFLGSQASTMLDTSASPSRSAPAASRLPPGSTTRATFPLTAS